MLVFSTSHRNWYCRTLSLLVCVNLLDWRWHREQGPQGPSWHFLELAMLWKQYKYANRSPSALETAYVLLW